MQKSMQNTIDTQTGDAGIFNPKIFAEFESIKSDFQNPKKPFCYTVIDDFLENSFAENILREYPEVDPKKWVDTDTAATRNKWALPVIKNGYAATYYNEVSSPQFMKWIEKLSGFKGIQPDSDLTGAGYHQILDKGYLNVHIDFNRIIKKNLDRRLNLILYLNKNWEESFGGYLELWSFDDGKKRIENICPSFNRAVLFETNEKSFHGHPVPVNTNGTSSRKSLSSYYYTPCAKDKELPPFRNTLYKNTQGLSGALKNLIGFIASFRRRAIRAMKRRNDDKQ